MMRNGLASLALVVGLIGWIGSATAQTSAPEFPPALNTEQNPLRNVGGGALAARSPGNMVSAGVGRTLAAADFGRAIIEITEQPPGPDPKATFLSQAVEEIFSQLNRALLLLENVLRLRAGLEPRVPTDLGSLGNVGTGTNSGISSTDLQNLIGGS